MFLLTQIRAIIEYISTCQSAATYMRLWGVGNKSILLYTGLVKMYLLHKLYKLEEVIVLQKLNKTFIL